MDVPQVEVQETSVRLVLGQSFFKVNSKFRDGRIVEEIGHFELARVNGFDALVYLREHQRTGADFKNVVVQADGLVGQIRVADFLEVGFDLAAFPDVFARALIGQLAQLDRKSVV